MDLEAAERWVRGRLSKGRFRHVMGVVETAVRLAEEQRMPVEEARQVALLHDCAREMALPALLKAVQDSAIMVDEIEQRSVELLHAPVGAVLAQREFGLKRRAVDAIRFHTTGRPGMTDLDLLLLVADFIEPGRDFPEAQRARELARREGLRAAALAALTSTLRYVLEADKVIHPRTVEARNWLLASGTPEGMR